MKVKASYKTYEGCFLQVATYQANRSRAVEIWNKEDGPIAQITVCIPGAGLEDEEAVIDTNNCPWAMDFIKEYELGEDTGRKVRSGYCTYPVVKLDIEKMGNYFAEEA